MPDADRPESLPRIDLDSWSRRAHFAFFRGFVSPFWNVTAEVDRYITYPGQALAYKHGELKILEIRRRAEKALGDRFSLRDFHSALLGNGSLPLTVLDELMTEWIEEQVGE